MPLQVPSFLGQYTLYSYLFLLAKNIDCLQYEVASTPIVQPPSDSLPIDTSTYRYKLGPPVISWFIIPNIVICVSYTNYYSYSQILSIRTIVFMILS